MRPRKLQSPVTLFAAIEEAQYESIRNLAFQQRQSIADVVRKALDEHLKRNRGKSRSRANPARREMVGSA